MDPQQAYNPATPLHQKSGEKLNDLISSIEAEHHLGLQVQIGRSPNAKLDKLLPDIVYRQIQQLYWTSLSTLSQILSDFSNEVVNVEQGERLKHLNMKLKERPATPRSYTKTNVHLPAYNPSKSLVSQSSGEASRLVLHRRDEESESLYMTAPETGSLTNIESDYEMPPSPTPSSRFGQRRPHPAFSFPLRASDKKRHSENSGEHNTSPKFLRTSQHREKQPRSGQASPIAQQPRILFKKPSLVLDRSYNSESAAPSSNTSFNSTPFLSPKQNQTQPNTAATSFDSTFGMQASIQKGFTRSDPPAIGGTLSHHELLQLDDRLRQEQGLQFLTRDRTSTTCDVFTYNLSANTSVQLEQGATMQSNQDPRAECLPLRPPHQSTEQQTLHATTMPLPRPRTPQSDKTLSEPFLQTPQSGKTGSRSPMAHYIRNLPHQNLFVDDVPEDLSGYTHFILFICQRIAIEREISLQTILDNLHPQSCVDFPAFQDFCSIYLNISRAALRESEDVWTSSKQNFDGYTFKGRVNFNKRGSTHVFKLELSPLQEEKSCRFQRAFGSDRFLYLNFPTFDYRSRPLDFDFKQWEQLPSQFNTWLNEEHRFLGRRWRVFHVERIDAGKAGRHRSVKSTSQRVILFATEGNGIDAPCTVGEMLNWFLPFAESQDQSFCKVFARFGLGLSRTTPTFVFKPSQVRYVKDIYATGEAEDRQFDDPTLRWEEPQKPGIMNDGCSVMSVGAARAIWNHYHQTTGSTSAIPSVFQGRIGGAKGLWMISAETYTKDPHHLDTWIEISESQLKFRPNSDDYFDETYNPLRLTFELVKHSACATPSDLHSSFIPIMVDRGVRVNDIARMMIKGLDFERRELLSVLTDPVQMLRWVHKTAPNVRENAPHFQAALPQGLDDRIRLLLDSGFSPLKSPYLAQCLQKFIARQQLDQERALRAPLGKSTNLFGIADPLDVLDPGEIHVQFSTPFQDTTSDESYPWLKNVEVLLGRHPACRRSDIQKVRAIMHPRLGHLIDVIVFPRRGKFPLAQKLQGGDYDGDIFWLCWEPTLVDPFRNAPAPVHDLEPTRYGIKQDKRKVNEVMEVTDLTTVDNFLREAFAFCTAPSLLGAVTNYREKRAYAENRVFSETLDRLCDMHDLLVDAPKQGYSFSYPDFKHFVSNTLKIREEPKEPAYKLAIAECEKARDKPSREETRSGTIVSNYDNVLDILYFNTMTHHNDETRRKIQSAFSRVEEMDEVLQYPYKQQCLEDSPVIKQELENVVSSFKQILNKWNSGLASERNKGPGTEYYNHLINSCYNAIQALEPSQKDHPHIKPWLTQYLSEGRSMWGTIRASALYTTFPTKNRAAFVFNMAGRELAELKADSFQEKPRKLVAHIYAIMKPKPVRATTKTGENLSDDEFVMLSETIEGGR